MNQLYFIVMVGHDGGGGGYPPRDFNHISITRSDMALLTIGDQFPAYRLTALIPGDLSKIDAKQPEDYFTTIASEGHTTVGELRDRKWRVVFFWPKDFTFVCPTEIAAFGKLNKEFADRDAQILGGSIDSEYVHHAWRTHHADLKDLPFPMLADVKRDLTGQLGILDPEVGVAQRA